MIVCILALVPRGCEAASRFPGAWSLETLGARGWPLYFDRMPRAVAKLLAIEEDISRGAYLRWVGGDSFFDAVESFLFSFLSSASCVGRFALVDKSFSL